MRRTITFIIFLLTSAYIHAQQTEGSIQTQIEAITDDPAFSQAVIGVCARTIDGRELADINAEMMMLPASNMKLISTGAALHTLGPDWKFETNIGYEGTIEDGTLHGDIYIVGGGDPTLGSKDSIAVSLERTFAQWEAFIRAEGITKIEGHIIGDGRWFEGMAEEPTWLMNDAGTYYGTGTTGLMFYENMMSFSVSAGSEVGAPVNIKPYYPETPWMEYRYNCSTGAEGTGDLLYMFGSDLAPVAEIRGTFAVDRASKRLDCSNKYPEYTCAYYFQKYLKKKGIECAEGIGDFRLETQWEAKGEINILGKTSSPALSRIVFETNHASNNLYAETLIRNLGREITGSACYDSSYVAINNVVTGLGVDTSRGARIKDGSGLSRQNYVSSDFLCRFLLGMMDSPHFEDFVESLPSPGGDGTLKYNMKKYPEGMKVRIKAKSGSMNGVRCYSGYIIPTDGSREDVIIFSLMINNCTASSTQMRNILDSMMAELAAEN